MAQDTDVTEENFGELLIQGLTEARAVARGDAEPVRRVRRSETTPAAAVQPCSALERKTPAEPHDTGPH